MRRHALDRARAALPSARALGAWPPAAGGTRARARPDRPIEMLVANDAETLDPRYATDPVGLRATRLVHAGLVRLDPDTLAPRPYLAKCWRWLDPLTLEVELRDDVRFHSGAPLAARRRRRDAARLRVAPRSRRVTRASSRPSRRRAPRGTHAVVVRLARPHATLLTDLELPILRADQADSPPAPDGTLDGLGPVRGRARRARRPPARSRRRRRAPAPGARASSFARCTTRTRARCVSRRAAPTSP